MINIGVILDHDYPGQDLTMRGNIEDNHFNGPFPTKYDEQFSFLKV